MQFRGHIAATLALAGLAACKEPPSYRLRWTFEGDDAPSVVACAETGVFQVQATAFALRGIDEPNFAGFIRDERVFPCYPSAFDHEDPVAGPALPPGDYVIQLRGLDRADDHWDTGQVGSPIVNEAEGRLCEDGLDCGPAAPFCLLGRCRDGSTGDPCEDDAHCAVPLRCNPDEQCEHVTGCDPAQGYAQCLADQLVCDCQRLTVAPEGTSPPAEDGVTVVEEAATAELPAFVLQPPPQCVDGIDNDRDGLVDVGDPACNVDFGDGTEGVAVGVTELRLDLTLLARNPAVTCSSVPLRRLRLSVVGESDSEVVLEEPCQLDQPYLASLRLPAGPATFKVVGVGLSSDPVTVEKTFEAEISPIGGTVPHTIDFGPDDFLEPIVSAIRVQPGYVSELGPEAVPRYSCEPRELAAATDDQPAILEGTLTIDRLRLQLLNGHGGPLEAPAALDDGTVLDGPTSVSCRNEVVTAPLEWGSYALVVEALSAAGEVCFSNAGAPALMSPGGTSTLLMARSYEGGQVPASCHDCETDADCNLEGELYCVDNVCQRGCASDDECLSDELGDLGFVCTDDGCRRP